MRRRNHRTKEAETLKKMDPQFGFANPDPWSSRANSDLKRRRRVSFVDRIPLNDDSPEAQTGQWLDAKTSEFAFFNKLKSGFGLCSESRGSEPSNKVKQNPKTSESRSHGECAGTDREAKDKRDGYSFSTPIHTACGLSMSPANFTRKDKEEGPGKSSSGFSRVKDINNLRCDEKGDLFSVKRKGLNQWVKDTWFPELTSNGGDLVSLLLTRLFPGNEETHPSRFSKEGTGGIKRRRAFDSPGPKFLKRSHESYTEADHSLMERDRSISCQGWLEDSIAPITCLHQWRLMSLDWKLLKMTGSGISRACHDLL